MTPGASHDDASHPARFVRVGGGRGAAVAQADGPLREFSGLGVLLCPQFGIQAVSSYRSLRAWGEHLAGDGHLALRLDLPGTGDSPGGPEDPDRLGAWAESIDQAAGWLREAGSERVAIIGVGLGALVAAAALVRGTTVDDVVLWGTPARGRRLVREFRSIGRLEPPPPEGFPPLPEGAIMAGGYLMSAETVQALEALDLSAADFAGRAGRALLLERDGLAPDADLAEALESSGVQVSTAPGPGFADMNTAPHRARPPVKVIEGVSGWLARAAESPAGPFPTPTIRDQPMDLTEDASTVREEEFSIMHGSLRLSGIRCEPAHGAPASVCAVFMNAGAIRRIGPNRMWVEAARRWAARGVPSVRFDVEGVGETNGNTGVYADETGFYVPELISQVRTVLDALPAEGLPDRFMLVGLCSGGYWAFQTAVHEPRVHSIALLNPGAFVWTSSTSGDRLARVGRRSLLRPSVWWRIIRGEVHRDQAAELARWVIHAPLRLLDRLRGREGAGQSVAVDTDAALDRLSAAGTEILYASAGREMVHGEWEREGRFARVARWPNLHLATLPGTDHTLRSQAAQAGAHELLDETLERELARASADRAAVG
jgi:pimeloyl-ACP methyl ester carboxylesterase